MPPTRISLLDLAVTFAQIGFSSIGGAAAPLRHGIVSRRRWLDEAQFSEIFAICQALPGAPGANVAVALGQRFAGLAGAATALAAMTIPTMVFAIGIATVALTFAATNVRVAHAEAAIAAGAAGMFVANGTRLGRVLWRTDARVPRIRIARAGISLLGIALVVALHVSVLIAVAILVPLGVVAETLRHEGGR